MIAKCNSSIEVCSPFAISPVHIKDTPMRRCPLMSGMIAPCFSARARNRAASSRSASPLNATWFASQKPLRTNNCCGSAGRLAQGFRPFDEQPCLLQAPQSFRALPCLWCSLGRKRVQSETRSADDAASGVAGKAEICVKRAGYLRYGLYKSRAPQRPLSGLAPQAAAFSISPASVQ